MIIDQLVSGCVLDVVSIHRLLGFDRILCIVLRSDYPIMTSEGRGSPTGL